MRFNPYLFQNENCWGETATVDEFSEMDNRGINEDIYSNPKNDIQLVNSMGR